MREHITRHTKRIATAIIGGAVVLIGLVLIPYPGPGWLIVFAGLAILAIEFVWAQRLLDQLRGKYEAWLVWLKRQRLTTRIFFLVVTGLVVIVTIWLLNGYGFINDWLHLGLNWLDSPIPIFH